MKRKAFFLLSVLAGVVLTAWLLQAGAPSAEKAVDATQVKAPGTAGMKVYIDPATGEFLEGPPEPVIAEPVKDINSPLSTSSEGLQEVAAPVGGGVMVDLKGRFQQRARATVDDSGNVTVGCDRDDSDAAAGSDGGKE
jgi:hypothetical protein